MKTKIKTITAVMMMAAFLGMTLFSGFAGAKTSEAVKTVDSASAGAMNLVKMLTSQLDVTEKQATGGAGSLFGMAKELLPKTDYSKVAGAIPGIGDLIKSAPAVSKTTADSSDKLVDLTQGLGAITEAVGKAGKYAAVYDQFKKLGLDMNMVSKFVPVILSFAESAGGETVMKILKSVWPE